MRGRTTGEMEVGSCGDLRASSLEDDGAHAHGGRSVEFEGTDKYADARADASSEQTDAEEKTEAAATLTERTLTSETLALEVRT